MYRHHTVCRSASTEFHYIRPGFAGSPIGGFSPTLYNNALHIFMYIYTDFFLQSFIGIVPMDLTASQNTITSGINRGVSWVRKSLFKNTHNTRNLLLILFVAMVLLTGFILPCLDFGRLYGTDDYSHLYHTQRMAATTSLTSFYDNMKNEVSSADSDINPFNYPFGLWLYGSVLIKLSGLSPIRCHLPVHHSVLYPSRRLILLLFRRISYYHRTTSYWHPVFPFYAQYGIIRTLLPPISVHSTLSVSHNVHRIPGHD